EAKLPSRKKEGSFLRLLSQKRRNVANKPGIGVGAYCLNQGCEIMNLGGQTISELAKRVWADILKDRIFGRSAELAYYFLLALFPLLLFLTSVIGIFLGS